MVLRKWESMSPPSFRESPIANYRRFLFFVGEGLGKTHIFLEQAQGGFTVSSFGALFFWVETALR